MTSVIRQTLDSLLAQFSSTTFVHDGSDASNLAAAFSADCDLVILIAMAENPSRPRGLALKSLSYLGRGDRIDRLDRLDLGNNLSGMELLEAVAGTRTNGILAERPSALAWFSFGRATSLPQSLFEYAADVYQLIVTTSNNYDNYFRGQTYLRSKPSDEMIAGALNQHSAKKHPRFGSHEEICEALCRLDRSSAVVTSARFFRLGGLAPEKVKDIGDDELRASLRHLETNESITSLPISMDREFMNALKHSTVYKVPTVGVARSAAGQSTHFGMVPKFDRTVRQQPVEMLLLLTSTSPISRLTFSSAITWISEFVLKQLLEKEEFIQSVHVKTQELVSRSFSEANIASAKWRTGIFTEFADWVCAELKKLTSATSVGLVVADINKRLLNVLVVSKDKGGDYTYPEQLRNGLSLVPVESSALAFAWSQKTDRRTLYLPDADNLPEDIRTQGLRQILRVRSNTKSEFIIHVFRGELLYAMVNLESPAIDAFAREQSFFDRCSIALSQFVTRLYSFGDPLGAGEFGQRQLSLHAVADMVRRWNADDHSAADQAMDIVRKLRATNRNKEDGERDMQDRVGAIGGLLDQIKREIEWHLSKFRPDELDAAVSEIIDGELPSDLPSELILSLQLILESLLSNVARGPVTKGNRFIFRTHEIRTKVLEVAWHCGADLAVDTDGLLYLPVSKRDGRHYGLFMVGLYARATGGHAEIRRGSCFSADSNQGFTVTVLIPYSNLVENERHGRKND